jgi:class 3 adenylate cyclase
LHSDLREFMRFTEIEPATTVERVLDTLATLMSATADQFGGIIRYGLGDSYCVTYSAAGGCGEPFKRALEGGKRSAGVQLCD